MEGFLVLQELQLQPGALAHGGGNFLHLGAAGIGAQHRTGRPNAVQDGQRARDEDEQRADKYHLAHADQMLEILASVRPATGQPFGELEHLVLNHIRAVSGCICVLMAWDGERRSFIEDKGPQTGERRLHDLPQP